MKTILPLIVVSLLLTACRKHPSDAAIRHKISGTWISISDSSVKQTIYPDGSMQIITGESSTVDGTWTIVGGVLIETLTHLSATNTSGDVFDEKLNQVSRYEVVSINDHDLVCRISSQTNLWKAHKP